jgi:WD40 repeat protein
MAIPHGAYCVSSFVISRSAIGIRQRRIVTRFVQAVVAAALLFLFTPCVDAKEETQRPFLSMRGLESSCFATNQTLLISTSSGELCLWSLKSYSELRRQKIGAMPLSGLVVGEDGKTLVAVCGNEEIVVFDLSVWKTINKISVPAVVKRIAISTSSKTIVAGCADGVIRLYDCASGREMRSFTPSRTDLDVSSIVAIIAPNKVVMGPIPVRPTIWDVALSRDNKTVVASYDGVSRNNKVNVIVWDIASGKPVIRFRTDSFFGGAVSFHPKLKNMLVIMGRNNRTINHCKVGNHSTLVPDVTLPSWVRILSYTPDGSQVVATCLDGAIYLLDGKKEPILLHQIHDPPTYILAIALSPDSQLIAVTAFNGTDKVGEVWIWNIATHKMIRSAPVQLRRQ